MNCICADVADLTLREARRSEEVRKEKRKALDNYKFM